MPTLDTYRRLLTEKKYHEAAREACLQAAEFIKGQNSGADVSPTGETTPQNTLSETVDRYLHAARQVVRLALHDGAFHNGDWETVRAIRDDRELMDTLGDELKRELSLAIAEDAPTLVMRHPGLGA